MGAARASTPAGITSLQHSVCCGNYGKLLRKLRYARGDRRAGDHRPKPSWPSEPHASDPVELALHTHGRNQHHVATILPSFHR